MPFTYRPYHRFPVHCAVTYNAGLFQSHGTAWNLSPTVVLITVFILIGFFFTQVARSADIDIQNPQEKFLCVVDKSSGVSYNKTLKDWESTTFHAGDKYLISPYVSPVPNPTNPEYVFQITQLGTSLPTGWCKAGFTKNGFLFCNMVGGEFRFNRDNGRFLMSYMLGYYGVPSGSVNTPDENNNTPYLAIGKCSPF